MENVVTGIRFLRLPQLIQKTGLQRSTIYLAIKQGRFPAPVKLSARASGWDAEAIEFWLQSRLANAR